MYFLLIFIFGCRSSPEASFINLRKAFISWYFKYHPVESTRFNMQGNHGKYKLNGASEREEYSADIVRFLIELSQIDITKISEDARIDYNILYSKLEEMKYIVEKIRPWVWNPLWTLNEINEGIYILSERKNLDMDVRVESIQSRLESIPAILDNSQKSMSSQSKLHILYSNDQLDKLMVMLLQLPLKLNSDNITLDRIDLLIEQSVKALLEYKKWINSIAMELDEFNFPSDIDLMHEGFSIYTKGKYLPEPVYKLAEKKLNPTQDRLFNLALPIYLIKNDEPVWMDREDTLEVIQWTINNIHENSEFSVKNEDVLSQFYKSITGIEKFVYNNSLLLKNNNKTIQLEFSPIYNSSITSIFLFDHYPKNIDMDIIYNIMPPSENYDEYHLNRYEIDIINARNIIPGYGILLAHAQRYPSILRYLFPDPVTNAGWQIYSVKMLIEEGFGNWENEYHILKLKEEISVIVSAIVEGRYYTNLMNGNDAIQYYQQMSFMTQNEAEIQQMKSELDYFSGTQSFIGFMEMNSLLNEYKGNYEDEFELYKFHSFVLNDGIIPLHELKKRVFSP